jgi:hypothetical protein
MSGRLKGRASKPAFPKTKDLINDGHELSNTAVDANLKSLLTPSLASSWYREGGKVIITWDEDEGEKIILTVVPLAPSNGSITSRVGCWPGDVAGEPRDHEAGVRSLEPWGYGCCSRGLRSGCRMVGSRGLA